MANVKVVGNLKLETKIFIKGKIVAETGIHIGGSSIGLEIGGADQVVVRDPITKKPYIPGSSLKGKMRSLLEKLYGKIKIEAIEDDIKGRNKENNNNEKKVIKDFRGKIWDIPSDSLVQFFGISADSIKDEIKKNINVNDKIIKIEDWINYAPTRIQIRDGFLCEESKNELSDSEYTDMYLTEIKTETSIDRLTSKANPRNFERVPAGARFDLNIVIDLYNVDFEKKENISDNEEILRAEYFIKLLKQGLLLIQDDYLGGNGSRGYGKVRFVIDNILLKTKDSYLEGKIYEIINKENNSKSFFNENDKVINDMKIIKENLNKFDGVIDKLKELEEIFKDNEKNKIDDGKLKNENG